MAGVSTPFTVPVTDQTDDALNILVENLRLQASSNLHIIWKKCIICKNFGYKVAPRK